MEDREPLDIVSYTTEERRLDGKWFVIGGDLFGGAAISFECADYDHAHTLAAALEGPPSGMAQDTGRSWAEGMTAVRVPG